MLEDGYTRVSVPAQCPGTSQLPHSNQRRWEESGTVTTGIGFYDEFVKVPIRALSRIYTSGSGVQHTCYDLSLPKDEVQVIKTQAAKVASSPTCRCVIRLLGLTNFASMVLPLAILLSCPYSSSLRDLQNSSQPVQGAEAQFRGNPSSVLVAHPQATNKINMQTFSRGGSNNRCLQVGF